MLSVYTRHYPPCAQSDPYYRRCRCPKWIMGIVETTGAFVRVSARTRAWEKAEKKARLMDAEAADPSPARVTVEDALNAFIARKQGQRLSHSWLYKFSLMQRELVSFAQGRGLTYIDDSTTTNSVCSLDLGRSHPSPPRNGRNAGTPSSPTACVNAG